MHISLFIKLVLDTAQISNFARKNQKKKAINMKNEFKKYKQNSLNIIIGISLINKKYWLGVICGKR